MFNFMLQLERHGAFLAVETRLAPSPDHYGAG